MNGLTAMFIDIESKVQVALKSKSKIEILGFQVVKSVFPECLVLNIETGKARLSGLLRKEENNVNVWCLISPLAVEYKEVKK